MKNWKDSKRWKVKENMKVGGMKSLTNEIIRKRVKNNQNLGKIPYGNFSGRNLIYIL